MVIFNCKCNIATAMNGGEFMERITLDVTEIAKILGVSKTTIYTMVRNNEIPHKRIRGKITFHRETIENWLATPTR